MPIYNIRNISLTVLAVTALSACDGGFGSIGNSLGSIGSGSFGGQGNGNVASAEDGMPVNATAGTPPPARSIDAKTTTRGGWFGENSVDPNTSIQVNKYLWAASLDVLNFLPIQSADPFTGIISTGYGTPPGSGRAYRATILIHDPALDARSLRVSLMTRSGTVGLATTRAVEDAILTRARQLRVQDGRL